jgi:hypothetical protein
MPVAVAVLQKPVGSSGSERSARDASGGSSSPPRPAGRHSSLASLSLLRASYFSAISSKQQVTRESKASVAGCRQASKATTGSTPRPARMDGDGGSGSARASDACGDGNLLVTQLARWDGISLFLSLSISFSLEPNNG